MNPHRVRTRLLAAFLVLLVAALTLTVVGWWGMRSTQQALAGVERDLLPNISHALELAQRTTQLAALAPKLSDSATQQELEANRSAVEGLLEQIHRNTVDLQPTPELQGVLAHLQEGVGQHLRTLVELTRRKQALQARLDQQLARLERLGSALHDERAPPADPAVAALWSSLVLATAAQDAATIGRLQADVEALLLAARRRNALAALDPALAQGLAGLAGGRDALLSLRQDLLDLDARTDYIVVLTRAHADELSGEVSRYVAQLRAAAGERSEHVRRVIQSNETGMLVLALASLAIAAVATRYVRRLVGEIETITDVMSRLAQGDTAQATPATRRRDELGALARSFEVFRDHLLAKQRLLGELHTQRELLEAVHDSLTDGLAVFDRDGRLLLWNRRLAEMLAPHGAAPAEGLTAQAWLATLPDGSVWSAPLGGEAQGAAAFTQHEHLELRLPTGEVFDLRTRRMPAGGSVTLVTDLSARRAIETQLQQAQKLEVLGQLTGGVAHDFNNYLGTILGNLSLIEGDLAHSPKSHAQWQRVQRAARSAAGLTRRLLAFARRQPLQAEDVGVDEMVEQMRDLIEYSAGASVSVSFALASAPLAVHVDRGQLENALLNLVMNSAAAMPDGGRLEVATRAVDAALELRVSDTGSGMPEALTAKVFEPFFTTKAAGEGSGLGLSIVYGFVKQSGGDIAMTSKPGAGTTVTMRFPAALPRSDMAPALHEPSPQELTLAGLKLLVVDDDDAFRATLVDVLTKAEADVQAVPSAEDALAALQEAAAPSLLLSDICLGPGLDGLRLARHVRERWPALPVVLMSGLSPELFAQRSEWAGEFPFLQKPFAGPLLIASLHDISRAAQHS